MRILVKSQADLAQVTEIAGESRSLVQGGKESINSARPGGGFSTPGGGSGAAASDPHARIYRHKLAQKAWREKNKAYLREYMARWKAANPERLRGYRKQYKKGESLSTLMSILAAQGGKCALCGEGLVESRHLDHIVPRSKGGESKAGNYQFLCPTCNMAKGALTNDEFIAHIGKILAFLGD